MFVFCFDSPPIEIPKLAHTFCGNSPMLAIRRHGLRWEL